jgi:CheY-like chemotaxis protein
MIQNTMHKSNIKTKETHQQVLKQNRILIVDDCDVNKAVAQQYLERAGYQVETAEDGQQALEVLKSKQFDLILMDLVMPVMDGYEAARRIRNAGGARQNKKIKQLKIRPDMPDSNHKCACRANNAPSEKQACSDEDCKCRRAESDEDVNSAIRNPHSTRLSSSQAAFETVPIIGMSGHAPESVMEACCRAGMNDCIGKPLQRESLVSIVRKWTNGDSDIPRNPSIIDEPGPPQSHTAGNQPPIDIERTVAEFMGKTDLLAEVLKTFKTRVRTQINHIKQHLSGNNFSPISSEAHAIKGGAGNLGAFNLSQAAAELEEAADEESSARANAATQDLEKEFHRLVRYLEQSDMGKAI